MLRGAPGALGAVLVTAALGLTACGGPSVPTPNFGVDVSLPAQPAATSPLAVLVDDGAPASSSTYTLSLVDGTGKVVASVTPKRRGDDAGGCTVARLPVASASDHRVFFLDGDSTLSWLDSDGTTGKIRSLGNQKGTEVSFAVSPDESRMAVVTVVAISGGFHEEVAVETLGGAGGSTPIFTRTATGSGSAGEVSWPVGWDGDTLVLADGAPTPSGGCTAGPAVTGYDVVDPVSGEARLHMCFSTADGVPTGAPSMAGVLCTGHNGSALTTTLEAGAGSTTAFGGATCVARGVVSPDGSHAALVAPPCSPTGGPVTLDGHSGAATPTHATGIPVAWLDASHVVITDAGAVTVLDTSTMAIAKSAKGGVVDAVFPPGL